MSAVVEKGVLKLDGRSKFLLSADYPYYRDNKENWEDRLLKLKQAYIDVVTFYVPWRHHAIKIGENINIDFTGITQGNRDVKHFIELCKKIGLYIIIKPGPFIHAETNYGGLPEFVNPEVNSRLEFMLNSKSEKRYWHNPLPAPLGENFKDMVKEWYEIVDRELIAPNTYPSGNIVSIQILNEGIYSDGQKSVLEYDFSQSSIEFFRKFLQEKYNNIEEFNRINKTAYTDFTEINPPVKWEVNGSIEEITKFMDWSEYQGVYAKEVYEDYGSYIDSKLSYVININPALEETHGLDFWLTRVQPEIWGNVEYGFTNWIGVVSHDESAYSRYLTLTKRGKGPNMEENWGFSKLYDWRYKYPIIPFFQTILAIAGGGTGFNVYTGVGTAHWDDSIDSMHERPYPDCSPISHEGETSDKYEVMKLLNEYLSLYGEEIMDSISTKPITYGLYLPYSYAAAWNNNREEWQKLGLNVPRCGYKGLDSFQYNVRCKNYDFNMVNLQAETVENLLQNRIIVLVGAAYLEEDVQQKLLEYVRAGGKLVLLREVPTMNERFESCTILQDELFRHKVLEKVKDEKVSETEESLESAYLLTDVAGKVIYTIGENAIGYEVELGSGKGYFISSNLLSKNNNTASASFLDLISKITDSCEIKSEDYKTQVWNYRHTESDINHVFIISKSEEAKWHSVSLRDLKGNYQELKIKLPSKSAAIVRLKDGEITSYLAKGINEYDRSLETVELCFKNQHFTNDKPCDVLFIGEKGEKKVYCGTLEMEQN